MSEGKLMLTLIEGRNMVSMDSNGFSDPYCKLRLRNRKAKSKIKWKTLNPVWQEVFHFDLDSLDDALYIKVMDKDRMSSDDPMGYCAVVLNKLEPNKAVDTWMTLQGVDHGEIHLVLCWVPSETSTAFASAPVASSKPGASVPKNVVADAKTVSLEIFERAVRAAFQDGLGVGLKKGYNNGYQAAKRGDQPTPPKAPTSTLAFFISGEPTRGYIERILGDARADAESGGVAKSVGHVVASSAPQAASGQPAGAAPSGRVTVAASVTAKDLLDTVLAVGQLSTKAPANQKFISKLDARVSFLNDTIRNVDELVQDANEKSDIFGTVLVTLRSVLKYIQTYGKKAGRDTQENVKNEFDVLMGQLDHAFKTLRLAERKHKPPLPAAVSAAPEHKLPHWPPPPPAAPPAAVSTTNSPALGAPPPPPPPATAAEMDAFSAKYHNPAQKCVIIGADENEHVENWNKEAEEILARIAAMCAEDGNAAP